MLVGDSSSSSSVGSGIGASVAISSVKGGSTVVVVEYPMIGTVVVVVVVMSRKLPGETVAGGAGGEASPSTVEPSPVLATDVHPPHCGQVSAAIWPVTRSKSSSQKSLFMLPAPYVLQPPNPALNPADPSSVHAGFTKLPVAPTSGSSSDAEEVVGASAGVGVGAADIGCS